MKLRKNRPIERAGVNAARTLFEAAGYVFQEVELGNDYGKDAYVDLVDGDKVTGICVALQIKSGEKYRRASGYAIPLGEHEDIWRRSTLPMAGIVFDPDTGKLYWGSITSFLTQHETDTPPTMPISEQAELTSSTLESDFTTHYRELARGQGRASAVLQLCSPQADLRDDALLDCFAAGRHDPRFLIILRYLLPMLSGRSLKLGLALLSHVTPHPDIGWTKSNWIEPEVTRQVQAHLKWTLDELRYFMTAVPWEEWERGNTGQCLFMLMIEDPEIAPKLEKLATQNIPEGQEEVAWAALYLSVYFAGEDGGEKFDQLVEANDELLRLTLFGELAHAVGEFGYVSLFE